VHRADDRNVVDALADVRENVAHLDAALPVFLELVRRLESRAGLALRPELERDFLPVPFVERGLRIERVHL